MRRSTDIRTICVTLSVREADAVAAMKVATGLDTDANLMRVALYRFAAHLDVQTDTSLFAVRRRRERAAGTRAKAS